MSKGKKESFFWTSYSDLMTTLFFVMLVLFVLSMIVVKHNAQKANEEISRVLDSVKVSNEQLTRILNIDEQFKPLQESGMFKYYPDTRKFVAVDLIGQEIFNPNEVVIKPEFRQKTLEVGRVLDDLLKELTKNKEFKYQVVIEGNMANTWDKRYSKDLNESYIASYKRTLAVYKLWNDNNIGLRKYGVELLICGSGLNGLDREPREDNNKRFTIQIIPKVSRPKQSE